MANIQWNRVTWYSKLAAAILFLVVFAWAFYLGNQYAQISMAENKVFVPKKTPSIRESLVSDVTFTCAAGKTIQAQFMNNTVGQGSVALELSDGRTVLLPQTISADGGRYAKPDGSFVFWNKGDGAFVDEGAPYATKGQTMTYANCVAAMVGTPVVKNQ